MQENKAFKLPGSPELLGISGGAALVMVVLVLTGLDIGRPGQSLEGRPRVSRISLVTAHVTAIHAVFRPVYACVLCVLVSVLRTCRDVPHVSVLGPIPLAP